MYDPARERTSTPSIRFRTPLDYKKFSLLSLSLQLPNTILIFNFNMTATATTRGTVLRIELESVGGKYRSKKLGMSEKYGRQITLKL